MKIFAIKLIIAIVCLVTGCTTIQLSCDIYNNTGEDITLHKINGANEQEIIHIPVNSLVHISAWGMYEYRIVTPHHEWSYNTEKPISSFIETRSAGPWTKRVWKAQIEPDGKIFAIQPNTALPVNTFSLQPKNFPITPKP